MDALLLPLEKCQFLASLPWEYRATHTYLASAGLLEPLPAEFEVTQAEIGADLGDLRNDAEYRRMPSLTDNELWALLLPREWQYLRHVAAEFGRPGWEPRFLAMARQIIGQESLTDEQIRRLLDKDGEALRVLVPQHS